jgi:hypothetical protein
VGNEANQSGAAKKYIIGIDPGIAGGAYAVYNFRTKKLVDVKRLPLLELPNVLRKSHKLGKQTINLEEFCLGMRRYARDAVCAVVEIVHSMPGQGVSSTFRFGEAYGQIVGVLTALGVTVAGVEPSVWKSLLNLASFNKEESRVLASKEFSGMSWAWRLKKDHNLAEAALIAKFGERLIVNGKLAV